jgi:valyl-tRNA synthetase
MSTGGTYDPHAVEADIYRQWEQGGYFHAEAPPAASDEETRRRSDELRSAAEAARDEWRAERSEQAGGAGILPARRAGSPPHPGARRKPFTIVIPPPNVTGALHLGHALNNTCQDILIRWRRMCGDAAEWMPGTDHAGIATQAVVEKRLRTEEGWVRDTKNPEHRAFLEQRIWKWKEEYDERIIGQLRKMGFSCDWPRTRFTLDEVCARAVYHAFFEFFKAGLIYRGKRLVNWDVALQTAVADDEIVHETVKGHLWHVRYPIEKGEHRRPAGANQEEGSGIGEQGECKAPLCTRATKRRSDEATEGRDREIKRLRDQEREAQASAAPDASHTRAAADESRIHNPKPKMDAAGRTAASPPLPPDAREGVDYLVVATTRPETMLADTAVAVHPDDPRYKHLIGRNVVLPLMNRPIPVIGDGILVNPEFGTGCVKVTPGHDPNDAACQQRHPQIAIIDLLTPKLASEPIGRFINENGGSGIREQGTGGVQSSALHEKGEHRRAAGAEHNAGDALSQPDVHSRSSPLPHGRGSAGGATGHRTVFDYSGLTKEEARKRVVADLESLGLLEKVEPYETEIGHSDRSKTPIEPLRSEQWFLRTDAAPHGRACGPLADEAMDAVRDGRVRFFPGRYAKTYLDWLGEKRDWCISRQLWWGHRIPVWTAPSHFEYTELSFSNLDDAIEEGKLIVRPIQDNRELKTLVEVFGQQRAKEMLLGHPFAGDINVIKPAFCPSADFLDEFLTLAPRVGLEQDPDVLDTWFSSALWPMSTFGWPHGEGTGNREQGTEAEPACSLFPVPCSPSRRDFEFFFPTDVLATGRGIITLWVARMVMMSLYFTRRVPFRHVYIHPIIQDGQGRTMSKSVGNGVDPGDLIQLYGTDAMRFVLAQMATETQDLRVPVSYHCPHCGGLSPHSSVVPHNKVPAEIDRVKCRQCGREFATAWAPAALKEELGVGPDTSEKFELGRNFCNKLWQAATGFVLPNVKDVRIERGANGLHTSRPPAELDLFDRWIRTRLSHCIETVTEHLSAYRFAQAAEALRTFFWSEFCDWYLEECKVRLQEGSDEQRNDLKIVMLQVLDLTLCLMHPIIPFVTEAAWARVGEEVPKHHELIWPDGGERSRDQEIERSGEERDREIERSRPATGSAPRSLDLSISRSPSRSDTGSPSDGAAAPMLIVAPWPRGWAAAVDQECERRVGDQLQPVIVALRDMLVRINAIRAQAKQTVLRTLPAAVIRCEPVTADWLRQQDASIRRLARCDALEYGPDVARPAPAFSKVLTGIEVYVPVAGLADVELERKRLDKERTDLAGHLKRLDGKLSNAGFVANAPADVVEGERARQAELRDKLAAIERNLSELG